MKKMCAGGSIYGSTGVGIAADMVRIDVFRFPNKFISTFIQHLFRHLDVLRLHFEVGVFPNLFMSKNVVKDPDVSDAL